MPVLSRAPYERSTIQTPTWDLWLTNLVTAVNEATAAIGGPAAAGTLTGTTLAANVVNSSLTSVGTLVNLTVTNPITGSVTGAAGSAPAGTLTGATLAANVLASSLTSVGTLGNLTVTNPIVGSVTGSSGSTSGNAATATALQTPRAINGVNFDGTAPITVTAAASTLTGGTTAWTPVDASGAGLALTVTSALFQRIAQWLFFTCQVQYPATGSGANFTLGGLPVAPTANTGVARGLTTATVAFDYVAIGGTTTISSRAPITAGVGSNAQHSNALLILTGAYPV